MTQHLASQAVFTNSVFVLDWNRPAPLTEFFVPAMPELYFPEFRDCIGNSRLEPTHWVPHMRPMRAGGDNVTAHLHSLDRITGTPLLLAFPARRRRLSSVGRHASHCCA